METLIVQIWSLIAIPVIILGFWSTAMIKGNPRTLSQPLFTLLSSVFIGEAIILIIFGNWVIAIVLLILGLAMSTRIQALFKSKL